MDMTVIYHGDKTVNKAVLIAKAVAVVWNNAYLFSPVSKPYIERTLNNVSDAQGES